VLVVWGWGSWGLLGAPGFAHGSFVRGVLTCGGFARRRAKLLELNSKPRAKAVTRKIAVAEGDNTTLEEVLHQVGWRR
jgi:hypothetical protein